jgi:hypothetical protein
VSDLESAKAALDRITIPQDSLDLIVEKVSPRSALIISDEALSSETGNATEFVVPLSGEPQGGNRPRLTYSEILEFTNVRLATFMNCWKVVYKTKKSILRRSLQR